MVELLTALLAGLIVLAIASHEGLCSEYRLEQVNFNPGDILDIPEGTAYIVKVIAIWRQPDEEFFQLYQVIEHARSLDADNATTALEDLVHLAAHLDLATNPIHGDLVGSDLAGHFFDRRVEAFAPPKAGTGALVIDLVRRYVHVHRDIIWPHRSLFNVLRRLGFEVAQTNGRWRRVPYETLWRTGVNYSGSSREILLPVSTGSKNPLCRSGPATLESEIDLLAVSQLALHTKRWRRVIGHE